jgi:hypothetical protein
LELPPSTLESDLVWYELAIDTGEDGIDDGDLFPDRVRVHSVPFALRAGDADSLGGLVAQDYLPSASLSTQVWSLEGNAAGEFDFLGTTNDRALELHVNGQRAFRLIPDATSPNVLGGNPSNTIEDGVSGGVISGGGWAGFDRNQVSASFGSIGGGLRNAVSGEYGVISGGWANTVSGSRATLGGGEENNASGPFSTVGGGYTNEASGEYSTVGGGYINHATGAGATVGGGHNNEAGGGSVVAGGASNGATGPSTFVGGGYSNLAAGTNSTVGGGIDNEALGGRSVIAGGDTNQATATLTFIGGGFSNLATGSYAVAAGGFDNEASGTSSAVAGGSNNQATATQAFVGGGYSNTASGLASTVPGGFQNRAAGTSSFAAGSVAEARHDGSFVWSDQSTFNPFQSTQENQFAVQAENGMWLSKNAPPDKEVEFGEYYRDNSILAWAKVSASGIVNASHGLESVAHVPASGIYTLTVTDAAQYANALIPTANAEIDTAPAAAADLRIVSINQKNSAPYKSFDVFINRGTGALVDNDFVFMLTGR